MDVDVYVVDVQNNQTSRVIGNRNTAPAISRVWGKDDGLETILIPCFSYKRKFLGNVSPVEFVKQSCRHDLKSKVTFYHVGKGGGGSVSSKFDEYGIAKKGVHPSPSDSGIADILDGVNKTLIINVRDPVDRFVSAFDWRSLLFCSPDDKRTRELFPSTRGVLILGATIAPPALTSVFFTCVFSFSAMHRQYW